MAESFAFGIAQQVLEKLGSTLLQEVGLAWGVKTELEELRDTLSTIRSVLLDAEEKQASNHQLRDWLGKLKDAFYDAEDVVDEFEYEALRQQVVASGSFKTKVRSFFSTPKSVAFNFKMGHRVKKIRERLDKIAADKCKFNLLEGVANTPVVLRKREMTHSFVRASDVIGRDDDKENIVRLLMQSSDTENVSVIPIVGIGGLGKTTLAKLVYNDERVAGHFSVKMWVCVSQEFDIKQLVKKILKEIKKGAENYVDFSMEQLQSHLRNALDGEKFLLVLDDVWNTDREKWLKLKDLLMDGNSGSKILVTTRKKSVASIMGTFPMQELKGLSHEECLSIFVKCAFKDGEDKQHPNLVKIGHQIVEKCAGVPLAVRSLGSLLYSKKDEREWVSLRDSEIWEAEQIEDGIMAALKLSYYDLPYHLKQCLALCSIFPKDFEWTNVVLISFWMAQGLIQSSGQNARMEDTGEIYINELLSRSFFQDVEEIIPGVAYNLKMHDLVHDLAISFAQPEYFTLNFHSENIPKKIRHVAFSDNKWPKKEYEALRFLEKLNNVRTIYFQMENVSPGDKSFVSACIVRFKCIRVLDLFESSFEALPNSIGSLKHLRYLNLCVNNKIKKLPNSICRLYHLQTLMLTDCSKLEELPRDIGTTMISLRVLGITTKQRNLSKNRKGLSYWNSLQQLHICDCPNMEFLFEGMGGLIALRTLTIESCPSLVSLSHNIKLLLTALEVLHIWDCEKFEFVDGEAKGQEDIQSFGSLQILGLEGLPRLEALPKWLLHGPTSNTLHHLKFSKCSNLKTLPNEGLQKLTSLQKLEIEDCPELIGRCKPETGEDWQKIAHIPEIYFNGEKITSSTNGGVGEKCASAGLDES